MGEARAGRDAKELLSRLKPDLVVIDPDPAKIQMGMAVDVIYQIAPTKDREGNEYLTYYFKPRP